MPIQKIELGVLGVLPDKDRGSKPSLIQDPEQAVVVLLVEVFKVALQRFDRAIVDGWQVGQVMDLQCKTFLILR